MKSICFESLKRERMKYQRPPKPKQLDPSWYTDNIYSNHSIDLDEDYIPDCFKYNTYRRLRDISENDEFFIPDDYLLHRSRSCKDFLQSNPPIKSRSCCFDNYDENLLYHYNQLHHHYHQHLAQQQQQQQQQQHQQPLLSSLTKPAVPKSYSFSGSRVAKTKPFDVMDYELPTSKSTSQSFRRDKKNLRKAIDYYFQDPPPTRQFRCCARDRCTNSKCLLEEICNYNRRRERRPYSNGSRRNLIAEWEERNFNSNNNNNSNSNNNNNNNNSNINNKRNNRPPLRYSNSCEEYCTYRHQPGIIKQRRPCYNSDYALDQHHFSDNLFDNSPNQNGPVIIDTGPNIIYDDEYPCHDTNPLHQHQHEQQQSQQQSKQQQQQQPHHHHHHYHQHPRRSLYETDLDNFIRDERSRLMNQDKFLDDDEIFLRHHQYQPRRNKSMLEVKPPNKYDDDTCSESTEMELEDFNFDIEKYWEELDKPPSPIDLDMQQRNMNKNLKTKNVNVGCYNNGMPISEHDREQERAIIKKNLLDGMPSPPQQEQPISQHIQQMHHQQQQQQQQHHQINFQQSSQNHPNNLQSDFHFFDHSSSPFHHRYSHKIYPETTPFYKYNNFYHPHDNLHQQQQQQQHNSNNNHSHQNHNNNSAISLINNIFSIYKPNKYSPLNCQLNNSNINNNLLNNRDYINNKPLSGGGIITKKMNVPSTIRPLGAPHSEYMNSMKRPLIVSTEQPHFKIIPEKTGLKISPLFEFGDKKNKMKLKSTNRPLIFPH